MNARDNERFRYGRARFETSAGERRAGLHDGKGSRIGYGEHGQPLSLDTDAPLISICGSGGGKTSQILIPEILANPSKPRVVLDPRGEIVSVTLPALTTAGVYAWIWNPTGMHGLGSQAIQPLEILDINNRTFHADCEFIIASLLPMSGSSDGRYFELRANEWLKNIVKALVERDGSVSFPSIWRTLCSIEGDRDAWERFLDFMLQSSMAGVRATAGEMITKQAESPREFGSVIGEISGHLNFLDDPMLQDSLEKPTFRLADLCNPARPSSLFLVVPVDYLERWGAALRTVSTSMMLYRSRNASAPRIQLLLDEAGQLKKFEGLKQAITFGRGSGISTWSFFQDIGQITEYYGKSGLQTFLGSSVLRQFFGVRDYETAKMVSDMLGHETLEYDDPLQQEAARRDRFNAAMDFVNGGDPMRAFNNMRSHGFDQRHRSKQARLLMTPDEVMDMPEDRQIAFISGKNVHPLYARKFPYFARREFAGKYLPNPYHPPEDRVRIATWWGQKTARVIEERVPEAFAHLPQYAHGTWKYVEGYRPKPRKRPRSRTAISGRPCGNSRPHPREEKRGMDHLKEKLRQDFKKAHDSHQRITETPVTKKELTAREKMREQPSHGLHLEPGGVARREVDSAPHAENERRIHFLRQRLGRMKGRAREGFQRSR